MIQLYSLVCAPGNRSYIDIGTDSAKSKTEKKKAKRGRPRDDDERP